MRPGGFVTQTLRGASTEDRCTIIETAESFRRTTKIHCGGDLMFFYEMAAVGLHYGHFRRPRIIVVRPPKNDALARDEETGYRLKIGIVDSNHSWPVQVKGVINNKRVLGAHLALQGNWKVPTAYHNH